MISDGDGLLRALRRLPPAPARVHRARRRDPPLRRATARARRRRSTRCCRARSARSSCPSDAHRLRPRLGIVLGSGLGGLADALTDADPLPVRRARGLPAAERRRPRRHARPSARSTACRSRSSRAASTSTRAATRARCGSRSARSSSSAPRRCCSPTRRARCSAEVGPGPADGDHRPHQPARRQPAHRAQRRRDRPALPEPARRLRPGAARRSCSAAATALDIDARRGRLPRHRRARPSRRRPRSACSAPSARTRSGCLRCPR